MEAEGAGPRDWFEAYLAVVDSIRDELARISRRFDWYELLSPGRRAVVLLDTLEAEVNNGGFEQYYGNSSGDGAVLAPDSLRLLGLEELAALVERANGVFGEPVLRDREERDEVLEDLEGAWESFDDEFFRRKPEEGDWAPTVGGRYIVAHPGEFFVDG